MSNDNKLHEIKVPVLPESISDAVVISWYKQPGDTINRDEPIVDIETDKVVLEVPSPVTGIVEKIIESNGSVVNAQQILGFVKEQSIDSKETTQTETETNKTCHSLQQQPIITPSAKKMIIENKLNPDSITGSGKDGRILKEDVIKVMTAPDAAQTPTPESINEDSIKRKDTQETAPEVSSPGSEAASDYYREEKRVPMTRLRARIAQRLLDAQQNAAILTTFNEVNMQPVMDLRSRYKELFNKTHEVKLGFMSFFVKAAVEALKQFPAVNASIDGEDIVYHGYFDIGVAVSSSRGLVVPVLKSTENMSMADIEKNIKDYAAKANENRLSLDEITGGTFSITNGGVFGSLLSTPILNPPQSGILGMHKIEQRPVVENKEIVIRPIMYLALSYDHRIIDGREAVQFLVAIKNYIEDPSRLLLEI